MQTIQHQLFVCECGDIDHQFVISSYPNEQEVYLLIHLAPDLSWYQKLWYALKYVFGKQSKYGAFGEIILDKATATRLIETINNHLSLDSDIDYTEHFENLG